MITRRSILRAAPALLLPRAARSQGVFFGAASAPTGNFTISLSYGASTNSAPAGFKPAMDAAAAYLAGLIFNSGSIQINIGWGEVGGGAVGGIASSLYNVDAFTYASVRTALIAKAKSANALQAVSTLPASAPGGVSFVWPTEAQQRALGLASPSPSYAWCGFATGTNWSYSGTPSVGQVDFREAALHEMTETMGRYANLGTIGGAGSMSVLDLYTYSANATRNLTTTGTRYFSIDSGATNQRGLGSGDLGDWSGGGLHAGQPSPFDGGATTGQLVPLLPCDTMLIDVLGYSSQ